jgi:hypothetical protein
MINQRGEICDASAIAMDEQYRFAAAVDLVIQFDASCVNVRPAAGLCP